MPGRTAAVGGAGGGRVCRAAGRCRSCPVLPPPTTPGGSDQDDEDRVQADDRQNYDRLTAMKRRCDPGNLFRLNHNITLEA
ncbi:BBE domain-containing protein [Streptomyces sp. NBC_00842]|uniref:BBE domain-containing protein n=1 Tax=unclassified Streptomyces TaxID=2593676 RepID=UPI00386AF10A